MPKVSWRKRLWVRIVVTLCVIGLISSGMWWWPRQAVIAVLRVGGIVQSQKDSSQVFSVMNWAYPAGWSSPAFERLQSFLGSLRTDQEITSVVLETSRVDDQWLVHLKRFPNLKWVDLHDRQLGPGLGELSGNQQLKGLTIEYCSQRHLDDLRRLPQLETLMILNPQTGDMGVEQLRFLPKLKELHFQDCLYTTEILSRVPELAELESLNFFKCKMSDDDLIQLQRLPKLKQLDLAKSGPFNDVGLVNLARLSNLEVLAIRHSSGQFTDAGLQVLETLENLKELIILRGDFSAQQIQILQETLPRTRILVL